MTLERTEPWDLIRNESIRLVVGRHYGLWLRLGRLNFSYWPPGAWRPFSRRQYHRERWWGDARVRWTEPPEPQPKETP